MMSIMEYRSIIDQIKGYAMHIQLFGYGEPFLNKDLLEMIGYAAAAGLYTNTSTNGQFFRDDDFCRDLVRSGLHHLIICLDGADQETLKKYRINSDFDEILAGYKRVIQMKKRLNSKTPKIELQFILMKHNEHQRAQMKRLAGELEVDYYCEKTAGINYNDPDFQQRAMELLPTDLSLSRFTVNSEGMYVLKGDIRNGCNTIYNAAIINADGTVLPCCYDSYSQYPMGNVFVDDLKTIWRNHKFRAFRRQVNVNRKQIPICRICSEGRYKISENQSVE
jgi:radical SAM protein with 4Fe4S-binding SPASM domain